MNNEIIGSKEGQDEMALRLLGHGTVTDQKFFLDLGSGHPLFGNNTVILEKAGWHGMLFDIDPWCCTEATSTRENSKAICHNLAATPILPFLEMNLVPHIIDYISFDVDDATLNLIESFPFDKYQFKFMTFEHDRYHKGRSIKEAMIRRLRGPRTMGQYRILAEDVCFAGNSENPENNFEDWWISESHMTTMAGQYMKGAHWKDVLHKFGALNR